VVRIALADGKVTWAAKTGSPVKAQPILHGGDVVVISSTGDLIRLDGKGGEKSRASLGASVSGGCFASGGMVYVTTADDSLMAFDLDRGVIRWTLRNLGTLMGPPVANGEALVIANADRDGTIVVLRP
ncbi:MAG: outer membrane protein assembly factor BamB family protein, partial [Planctomycetota bacterium]|jgi:outer membrane protein assembly factor BamB